MQTVSRIFTFDAAHMLTDYNGKCANLHGHTYTLEVTVAGEINEQGFVMDYAELKRKVESVLEVFDHAYIYNQYADEASAEKVIAHVLFGAGKKVVQLLGPSTTENIVEEINRCLYFEGLRPSKLKLSETPTTYVEVRYE